MDLWTIIGGLALIIGIVAGIVQVLDYLQKHREKRAPTHEEDGEMADEREHLRRMIEKLTDNLHTYEEQAASFGPLHVPLYITRQIEETREEIARLRAQLEALPLPFPEVAVPHPVIPQNLPPRGEFIGREKEKVRVREALSSRWPLTCIDGIGGIGKTALALEVTGECLRASKGEVPADGMPTFDGFIWTTAKDRELTLNDILDAIARTLDYPGIAQQPLEEKQESARKLLQTKPYLLIVDNFETVTDDAVRDFLLRLPEPSKALITSREQKLRQAWAVSLKGLERAEALALIRSEGRRLGLASVEEGEERVLLHLYQATGGAPLAIKWAVGQIKQKGQSLDSVLAALHEAKGDIFEEVFARSWSLLSDDARRILMVMPIFAASASRAAIEAASDVHHYILDEGLGQLVEMWLVEASEELDEAKRRYNVHPLTRAFAGARLGEDARFEKEARLRTARYFLEFSRQYAGENWESYDIVEAELENLFAIIEWCYTIHEWETFTGLMWELYRMLGARGYWRQRIEYGWRAVEVARSLGNTRSLAWFLTDALGWVLLKQGNYEHAEQCIKEGQVLLERIRDKGGLAQALRFLGRIARERGELDRAKQLGEEALRIAREENYKSLASAIHSDFGDLAFRQGNYREAERLYEKARLGFETRGKEERAGTRYIYLGDAILAQGRPEEAKQWYEGGLAIGQKFGRQDNIARAKYGLAKVSEQQNNLVEAARRAEEALAIFVRLGMQKEGEEARALVERLSGKLSAEK